jgi:uncharacterized protein (TIGR03435 family)
MWSGGGGCGAGLSRVTDLLSIDNVTDLRLPVLDETGLTGTFIYDMRFASPKAPQGTPASRWPSFATALEEQLGFRLEEGRAPVEVLIIDSVGHPTEN